MQLRVQYQYQYQCPPRGGDWSRPEIREFKSWTDASLWREQQLEASGDAYRVCSEAGLDVPLLVDIHLKEALWPEAEESFNRRSASMCRGTSQLKLISSAWLDCTSDTLTDAIDLVVKKDGHRERNR